jgi:hypothetical protein
MVRIRRTQIVNENEILTNDEIYDTTINETYIERVLENHLDTIKFLARICCIKNQQRCALCRSTPHMSLIKNKSLRDGYNWVCVRPCKYTVSVRKNS